MRQSLKLASFLASVLSLSSHTATAVAMSHGGSAGGALAHHATVASEAAKNEMPKPVHAAARAERDKSGFFAASSGYLIPGGDAGEAPSESPAMSYELRPVPQLTCFRPRLIMIGHQPVAKAHLPHVVYGGPLPCGYKG
jgi:hypothetical protein